MQLIELDGATWRRSDAPLPDWQDASAATSGAHVRLAVDDEPDPVLRGAASIAIEFPAFNDGRGLSLAVLLRTRLDYRGPIYAIGAVHEDVVHYLARCGFTGIALPADHDPDTALRLTRPYTAYYQGSAVDPRPRFRRESETATA